jgi:hypothetical protein
VDAGFRYLHVLKVQNQVSFNLENRTRSLPWSR